MMGSVVSTNVLRDGDQSENRHIYINSTYPQCIPSPCFALMSLKSIALSLGEQCTGDMNLRGMYALVQDNQEVRPHRRMVNNNIIPNRNHCKIEATEAFSDLFKSFADRNFIFILMIKDSPVPSISSEEGRLAQSRSFRENFLHNPRRPEGSRIVESIHEVATNVMLTGGAG